MAPDRVGPSDAVGAIGPLAADPRGACPSEGPREATVTFGGERWSRQARGAGEEIWPRGSESDRCHAGVRRKSARE